MNPQTVRPRPRVGPALCLLSFLAIAATGAAAQDVDLILPPDFGDLRDLLENVSLAMQLEADGTDTDAQSYVAAARADYRRLLTGLYAEGYYGGTISILIDGVEASGIAPLDAPRQVTRIDIVVTPGPEYLFGRAEIGPLAPGTVLPDGFATGQVAESDAIRAAARAAVAEWERDGHAKANAGASDITAIHPQERLDALVQIIPGPRLTFGDLTVRGNQAVRTERVREIAGYTPGDVYSPDAIDLAATRLRRTGAFQTVAFIESDTVGPDDTLPFTLQVDERKPRRIGAGAEISSLDGLSVSAYWLHRNLLGGAERFRVSGEVSDIDAADDGFDGSSGTDYRLDVSFARPATYKPDIDLIVTAFIGREDEPEYLLDSAGANFGLTQYVTPDLTYEASVGVLTAIEETEFRRRDYTLLTLPLNGRLDRRNDPLDPTSGYFIDLDVTPFLGVVGGASGGRFLADVRGYVSPGTGDRFTLAARGQIGSVVGADVLDAPADFLFYSGGSGTVRGQAYQSLALDSIANFGDGPVEITTGGASFAGAQLEARVGVTDNIGVVGFYDIGLVGRDALPDLDDDYQAGAGIGLRYKTGIGPIRLDLATPASGDEAGQRLEVYIGIGQTF